MNSWLHESIREGIEDMEAGRRCKDRHRRVTLAVVKVELSDRALLEMQRIDVSWRTRASLPDVFLDELEELVEWIETTGVIGPVYHAKAKRPVHRLLLEKSDYQKKRRSTRGTSTRPASTRSQIPEKWSTKALAGRVFTQR